MWDVREGRGDVHIDNQGGGMRVGVEMYNVQEDRGYKGRVRDL